MFFSCICKGIGLTEKQKDNKVSKIQKDLVFQKGAKKLPLKFEGQVREVECITMTGDSMYTRNFTNWAQVPVVMDLQITCMILGRGYNALKKDAREGKFPAFKNGVKNGL